MTFITLPENLLSIPSHFHLLILMMICEIAREMILRDLSTHSRLTISHAQAYACFLNSVFPFLQLPQ